MTRHCCNTKLRVTFYAIKEVVLTYLAQHIYYSQLLISKRLIYLPYYVLILKYRHYESTETHRNKAIVNLEIANQRVER